MSVQLLIFLQRAARGLEANRGRTVVIDEGLTPRVLAQRMGLKTGKLLGRLAELGEELKPDVAMDPEVAEIIISDFGQRPKRVDNKLADRVRTVEPSAEVMAEKGYPHRAPIVTVMGHVDHGKTTLLDALRGTNVAEREAGGITQGVAAFSVPMRAQAVAVGDRAAPSGGKKGKKVTAAELAKQKQQLGASPAAGAADPDAEEAPALPHMTATPAAAADDASLSQEPATPVAAPASRPAHCDVICFLDTPGHALFSSMRRRGTALTDVAVLVVDGKDGVMPQTKECVELLLESEVPTVVAVTKCDLVDADAAVTNVGKQLLALGMVTEQYGGDAPIVPISARTGMGLQALKDAIALQAELLELRAAAEAPGEAVILDARVVKGMGQVVDVIVRWGTLRVGDHVVAGNEYGRVKSLLTDAAAADSVNKRLAAGGGGGGGGGNSGNAARGAAGNSKAEGKKNKQREKDRDAGTEEAGEVTAAAGALALAPVEVAHPGTPVRVLGMRGLPPAGEDLLVVESEERAKAVLEGRTRKAQAAALTAVAAADAARRAKEREAYKQRRARKAAYDLAMQRERQRARFRKDGVEAPPELAVQPWEVIILQAGREGKVAGIGTAGNKVRQQGDQQTDVTAGYNASAPPAAGADAATSSAGGDGAADGSGADAAPAPAKQVVFMIKADSAAALVAVQDALARIPAQVPGVVPRVVSPAVGEVSERDVDLAADMGAHILAFNAKVSAAVQKHADRKKLKLRASRVIYHLLDEVADLLAEHLPSQTEEETLATAEVKAVFNLNAARKGEPERVAGCVISDGTFTRHADKFRLVRNGEVVAETTELGSLQHLKDRVESVKKGQECGMSLPDVRDYVVGDRIVAVKFKTVKPKLELRFE